MALTTGTQAADNGLSGAIFTQLDALLAPPLQDAVDKASAEAKPGAQTALTSARDGWRKLAFAVAAGVVEHLVANLEITGVIVAGTVTVPVTGTTGTAAPTNHTHGVGLTPAVAVSLSQSNDGPGRVR
jgi:hypothetical protein